MTATPWLCAPRIHSLATPRDSLAHDVQRSIRFAAVTTVAKTPCGRDAACSITNRQVEGSQPPMTRPSMLRVALLILAMYASINYLVFSGNPQHIGNLGFYLLSATADALAVVVLVSSWYTVPGSATSS